jgi:hypothetical protein
VGEGVADVPTVTVFGVNVSASELTTPDNTRATLLAVPATIVVDVVPWERMLPVPPVCE